MKAFKPINRRLAISLAVISLWLVGSIGVYLDIHSTNWLFLSLHGHDATTIKEIGWFFLAWAVAQFPAAWVAGGIMGFSASQHPIRSAFWVAGSYEIIASVIRAFHWPWWSIQNLDQSVPIIAYVISILSVIGFCVFSAWVAVMFRWVADRRFAH